MTDTDFNTVDSTEHSAEQGQNKAIEQTPKAVTGREIWQTFHWSFFINVQALIICLNRFKEDLMDSNFQQAETELLTAADMLTSSAAAMQLASAFSAQEYESTVRVSMMPPQVKADNFSGLMSWEHSALMIVWRKLRPIFRELPEALNSAHEQFVRAYYDMALGHTQVCDKFGGSEDGSIRFNERSGVETLKRFGRNRTGLIDPQQRVKGCPFSL